MDEIIVIDAQSKDNTVKLAESEGAKVYIREWNGYGKAKNFGAEMASNNWILSIDADERLSEKLKGSIEDLNLQNNEVYLVNRLTKLHTKWIRHSGWYPLPLPRLYNKAFAFWDDKEVHEELTTNSKSCLLYTSPSPRDS